MKYLLVLLALMPALLASRLNAQTPDSQYVAIYSTVQSADTLADNSRYTLALTKYKEADKALRKFKDTNPEWNPKIVKFRLDYLAEKIGRYSTPAGQTNNPPKVPIVVPSAPAAAPEKMTNQSASAAEVPAATGPAMQEHVQLMTQQIQRLQDDNTLLQAKLKEALSAQPAATDPRELAKAQEQIRGLEKENALLKASAGTASSKAAAPGATKSSASDLNDLKKEVARLAKSNAALTSENSDLQARLKGTTSPAASADDATISALRAENEVLRKQAVAAQSQAPAPTPAGAAEQKLTAAQSQIASLQSDNQLLRNEKSVLEDRLKQAAAAAAKEDPALVMTDSVTAEKIRALEAQRDELKKSLDAATKDLYGKSKGKVTAARIDEMTGELATLRARLDVFEARPVPLTDEERAALGYSRPFAASGPAARKSKPLPADVEHLVLTANTNLSNGQFKEAEENYQKALKSDPKNIPVLLSLAQAEVDLKNYPQSQEYLKTVRQIEANNAPAFFIEGQVEFEQRNYDAAVDALSQSVKIDPQDFRSQTLLGMTLCRMGHWAEAETALRKAIQVNPAIPDAHYFLAIAYISQQPPVVELANWHYKKAVEGGIPKNPELEKKLQGGVSGAP